MQERERRRWRGYFKLWDRRYSHYIAWHHQRIPLAAFHPSIREAIMARYTTTRADAFEVSLQDMDKDYAVLVLEKHKEVHNL